MKTKKKKRWCASCMTRGEDYECPSCGSEDTFTAEQILQGEMEQAIAYHKEDRADMFAFVLAEFKRPKAKKRKK